MTASVDCAVGSHRFVRPKIDGGNSALTQAIGSAADLIKDVKEHITGSGNWTQGGDQYAAGYAVECDSVAVKRRVAPFAAEAVVGSQHFATIAGWKSFTLVRTLGPRPEGALRRGQPRAADRDRAQGPRDMYIHHRRAGGTRVG